MITLCWAAKGGSGTTVVAATLALTSSEPTLLVDLDGDLPAAIGLPQPESPGLHDWLNSEAPTARLAGLEIAVQPHVHLLHAGSRHDGTRERWAELVDFLQREPRRIIIDAGTCQPRRELYDIAAQQWLVTRACYLSLRAAQRQQHRPNGVVLVEEPGRALRADDIETALGAPVVARLLQDPAVARAVDAGLLVSRLPAPFRRGLCGAA